MVFEGNTSSGRYTTGKSFGVFDATSIDKAIGAVLGLNVWLDLRGEFAGVIVLVRT